MVLLVFLGDAEVDVEQDGPPRRGGLRGLAGEQPTKPVDVDESLVVRQFLDGQIRIGRPRREPGFQRPDPAVPIGDQPRLESGGVLRSIRVEDDRAVRRDPLLPEQPDDLGFVDRVEPGGGECDRTGDVAAARLAVEAPAVECRDRPQVHDGQFGVVEALAKLVYRDDPCHRWFVPSRMVMSIGPRGREVRPVRGRRRPSWGFEGKQEAAATSVTTAPGPGSDGSCPRQLSAATLGPRPSHGGAACAYTCPGSSCERSRRNPTSLVGILATAYLTLGHGGLRRRQRDGSEPRRTAPLKWNYSDRPTRH